MSAELVSGIDRYERNRSRFIAEAVANELQRRRRLALLRSLQDPHPDSLTEARLGLQDWAESLGDAETDLLDPSTGVPVRWSQEQGWQDLLP